MPAVVRPDPAAEAVTRERCFILEAWNDERDPSVSIARARVVPGTATQRHSLDVDERYVVVAGRGIMHLGDLEPAAVAAGDVVVIPAGMPQRIENDGAEDLVFYCVCTPRFRPGGYRAL